MSRPLPFRHERLSGVSLSGLFAEVCDDVGVQELSSALQVGKAFRGLRLSGKDGDAFVLQLNGEPLRGMSGEPEGWHGTFSDMTREVAIEAALRQKIAAELASLAKSRFLSNVSHELRTPLNAVLGFSHLVLRADATPDRQRQQVQRVHQTGTWLLSMITDLLELSKIESGDLSVRMVDVDLRVACAEVMALVGDLAAERSIVVLGPEPGGPCRARADPDRLRQALSNLCTNAINYNRVQGEVRLTVESDLDGPHVRIVVADTGAGLTPDQIGRIFEPFERLGREASVIPGTGIGLSIAKALVEQMGGGSTW